MKTTFAKFLSCLLALTLVLSFCAITAFAETDDIIDTEEEINAAIAAIPEGSSGEITIENVFLGLAYSIFVENKDVTFNLVNANISATAQPVIFGYGANITINADDMSSMSSYGSTGMMGTVRIDSGYDWIPETESFTGTNHLTVNGGKYFSDADDACFLAASGTEVTLNNVLCDGIVDVVAFEGVGITKPGKLVINSGRFTTNITEFAANGKFSCNVGPFFYVRDTEVSDEFAEVFPENKITFNSATPQKDDESDATTWLLSEKFNEEHAPKFTLNPETFSDDFSTCEITMNADTANEEVHAVNVTWVYDKETKTAFDKVIANLPKGEDMGGGIFMPYVFKVSDLELINYWVTTAEKDEAQTMLINYSDEFKKCIGYKNFVLDTRYGDGDVFYTMAGGLAEFKYDGTTYATKEMEVQADHVLYVSNDTENTPDAVLAAAQKRLDEYIGEDSVELSYKGTVFEVLDGENFAATGLHLSPDINLEIETGVEGLKNDDFFFTAQVEDNCFNLVIKRDSDKMVTPVYQNVDLNTDISVATKATIPLDTVLNVEKATLDEAYTKILNSLNVEECDSVDIKLHSTSLDDYVTKLENDKFTVKIPVKQDVASKALAAFYIGEDGKVEEYDVTVKNGFAIFETNHFSVYTLAIKSADGVGESEAMPEPTPDIPKTGENNTVYIFMTVLCLGALGIMASRKVSKER